jgi:photosystem II stability/assembly factor-like uncharacterized protein
MFRKIYLWIVIIPMALFSCSEKNEVIPPVEPDGPSIWKVVSSEAGIVLKDVFFLDASTGWIVGTDNIILSTASGGASWSIAPVQEFEEIVNGVHFIDSQNGWLASDINETTPGGRVLRTLNGGAYPEQQLKVSGPMNAVFFVNQQKGWAVGSGGRLVRTEDGGFNWQQEILPGVDTLYSVKFVTPQKGWISGTGGAIFRTLDGLTWQKEEVEGDADIYSLHFTDSLHGWACGGQNTILKRQTSDGQPARWVRFSMPGEPNAFRWRDVFFVDQDHGWLVGQTGRIYKTTDGGATWNPEITEVQVQLNAIHMISTKRGWIAGNDGVILGYAPT